MFSTEHRPPKLRSPFVRLFERASAAGLAQLGAEWQAEPQAQGVCPYRQESDFLSILTYVVV